MADVYLTNPHGHRGGAVKRLRESAERDIMGVHRLTNQLEKADVVLFAETSYVGPTLRNIRRNEIYRRNRERCYAYSEYDFVVPLIPGIYPSVSNKWNVGNRARGGPYLSWYAKEEEALVVSSTARREFLFSFIGATRHAPIRKQIVQLSHPSALLDDSTWWYTTTDRSEHAARAYKARYVDSIARSHFVLCPLGLAASSVRLFDVMRMGRVPVIMSDEWLAPEGPNWPSFSIRVPERDVALLPDLLEQRASDAEEMGHAARQAWEAWFSPDVVFHRFTEACLSIERARTLPERVAQPLAATQFLFHPPTTKTCIWRLMHGKHERPVCP